MVEDCFKIKIGPAYRHLDDTTGAGEKHVLCVVLSQNRSPLGGFYFRRKTPRQLLEKKTPPEPSIEIGMSWVKFHFSLLPSG